MEISKLLRPHLQHLTPYSSARDDFHGKAEVYLDANENSFGSTSKKKFRRYPDPYQSDLKKKIGTLKDMDISKIFLGNGSDEPIDLLIRAFCNPGKDKIIITPPTYGMYEVSAAINDVGVIKVPLTSVYALDKEKIFEAIEPGIKLIFFCSPNNPTGNSMNKEDILEIADKFQGLVIVDEAYIDFSKQESLLGEMANYTNLVVLQTFSKAWGLASLRLGMAFANEEVIGILNMIKPPYNINGSTQELVLKALENKTEMLEMKKGIIAQREHLYNLLKEVDLVENIFPSDANFYLVQITNAHEVYHELIRRSVIVRDRSRVELCADCLRITVGTRAENEKLIHELKQISLSS
jgi:histidinol-phosphate aminotransferase